MRIKIWFALPLLALSSIAGFGHAAPEPAVLSVDAAHPGAAISPSMYGIFFEDINFGADGGLYPELVKNRSFEFQEPLTGWHEILGVNSTGLDPHKGELGIHTENPLNASNPHYLSVKVYAPGYSFYNTGYRGMGVAAGAEYRFSAYVRSAGPQIHPRHSDGCGWPRDREREAGRLRRDLEALRDRHPHHFH